MSEKRTEYTAETRAAVMASLTAGQSISQVAAEYKIPRGTVSSWARNTYKAAPVSTEKRALIGELLVDYLQSTLKALKAQTEVFADKEWLRAQEASQLAVLHGVMTDKAVRLLEAMGGEDA